MRILFQIISWLGVLGTILPSAMFLAGVLDLDQVKRLMLLAAIVWFVFTPLWMGRTAEVETAESGS